MGGDWDSPCPAQPRGKHRDLAITQPLPSLPEAAGPTSRGLLLLVLVQASDPAVGGAGHLLGVAGCLWSGNLNSEPWLGPAFLWAAAEGSWVSIRQGWGSRDGRVDRDVIHQALNLAKGSQPAMDGPEQTLPGQARPTLQTGDLCAQQRLRWMPEAHSINKHLLSVVQAGSRQ